MSGLSVIYEDNHLLVVDKPAELATMGAESGEDTLHRRACDYVREKYSKPGKVFLGVVSRLDSMTTGAIVLARTSKSASRLSPQFAATDGRGATKVYLAAVDGEFERDEGTLSVHVRKDDDARRMRVVPASTEGAKAAELQFSVLRRNAKSTLLACKLITGRKHQIRVTFADRGHPILGDRKYASRRQFTPGIALHSWKLRIDHPTLKDSRWFSARVPASWSEIEPGDAAAYIRSLESRWEEIAVSLGIDGL